jgi:hypothetical protein
MKNQGTKVGSVFLEITANSDQFKQTMAETYAQTKGETVTGKYERHALGIRTR